ncbi:MAG TPA: PCYCGC motif-containing (lipo)protein [Actinomycetota bacterium]|nr:PCYCGC motif-containing (lipo)protein [Actinomycetota bacterium]
MDRVANDRRAFGIALAIALSMVLTSAGAGAALLAGGAHGAHPRGPAPMAADPGLDLLTLPAPVAEHYLAAADHPNAYSEVPCFCGCEAMLDHRSLLDCFVRPAGGWEPHAAGCVVCLDESVMVRSMLARGSPISEIRSTVVDAYTA